MVGGMEQKWLHKFLTASLYQVLYYFIYLCPNWSYKVTLDLSAVAPNCPLSLHPRASHELGQSLCPHRRSCGNISCYLVVSTFALTHEYNILNALLLVIILRLKTILNLLS